MLPIRPNAFRYILLYGKRRLYSAVGVERVTPNFKVNIICGRWKCVYVSGIVGVLKILTANQDLHGHG